jgi:DNA polymerase IV
LPSAVARRRCPQAVFLSGDHALYSAVSEQVHEIFRRYTPLIEPLSLDEAFLDVTGSIRLFGDGVAIAERIRADVAGELELGCSVGVAPNKFLAKMASVSAKPRATPERVLPGSGVFEVVPGKELEFLHPLPVSRLWGVGPVTLDKLQRLGVRTIGDLAAIGERSVVAAVGRNHGSHLMELAAGHDERQVEPDREVKSIGHEETYDTDVFDLGDLERELVRLADGVATRLRRSEVAGRTITLKVRFAGFHTITRSVTLDSPVDTATEIVAAASPLLRAIDLSPGVRLLGVSAGNLGQPAHQLSLLDDSDAPHRAAGAIDEIRERFGSGAIGPASSVSPGGLRLVRKGAQQWGPDRPQPDS